MAIAMPNGTMRDRCDSETPFANDLAREVQQKSDTRRLIVDRGAGTSDLEFDDASKNAAGNWMNVSSLVHFPSTLNRSYNGQTISR
jgi:hypothetical protein